MPATSSKVNMFSSLERVFRYHHPGVTDCSFRLERDVTYAWYRELCKRCGNRFDCHCYSLNTSPIWPQVVHDPPDRRYAPTHPPVVDSTAAPLNQGPAATPIMGASPPSPQDNALFPPNLAAKSAVPTTVTESVAQPGPTSSNAPARPATPPGPSESVSQTTASSSAPTVKPARERQVTPKGLEADFGAPTPSPYAFSSVLKISSRGLPCTSMISQPVMTK